MISFRNFIIVSFLLHGIGLGGLGVAVTKIPIGSIDGDSIVVDLVLSSSLPFSEEAQGSTNQNRSKDVNQEPPPKKTSSKNKVESTSQNKRLPTIFENPPEGSKENVENGSPFVQPEPYPKIDGIREVTQGRPDGEPAVDVVSLPDEGSLTGSSPGVIQISEDYLAAVRRSLMRSKRYPWKAKMQGIEGTSHVVFQITQDGNVHNIQLIGSSKHPILDEEAIETVGRAAPFPPLPPDIGNRSIEIRVPLVFQLR